MPNPWDRGTTKALERLGFKAVATTSAGFAFSRGLPDTASAVSRDEMLCHIADLVSATNLPVNADFQAGYARDPEQVSDNVELCTATGAAGLSIEDATGDSRSPLFDRALAIDRIRAARKAIDSTGSGVVLTARCEARLVKIDDADEIIIDRLVAFADAGADCLYAPGIVEPGLISELVRRVAPKPVNVLVSSPNPHLSLRHLEDLGVRRISVGSALARVAWGGFLKSAEEMAESGTFNSFANAVAFDRLNRLFS